MRIRIQNTEFLYIKKVCAWELSRARAASILTWLVEAKVPTSSPLSSSIGNGSASKSMRKDLYFLFYFSVADLVGIPCF